MPEPGRKGSALRVGALTALAMVAFAANSVICRLALWDAGIDAASFTTIRLLSGAGALAGILVARSGVEALRGGSWVSAALLFTYAACFSFAYLSLSAATGALVLFSLVQGSMIVLGLREGHRPGRGEWWGWSLAAGGLIWLLLPGVEAPPWLGAALMAVAGIAWGAYSYGGRGARDPLAATAGNFVRAAPLALVLSLLSIGGLAVDVEGALLAALSGALTSGVGYVLWYAAVPGLSPIQAALVQLTVPVIAALGGVVALAEPLGSRLVMAGGLILGGLTLAVIGRRRPA